MTTIWETRPEGNIFIIKITEPFDPMIEIPVMQRKTAELIEKTSEMLHLITDLRAIKMSFSDMMMAMASSVNDEAPVNMKSVQAKTYFLGSDEMVSIMQQAYQQEQYGAMQIPMFSTLEEALEHINAA